MAKELTWDVMVGDLNYHVSFTRKFSGRHILSINGQENIIKPNAVEVYSQYDHPIMLGDKECRLVFNSKTADLVVDGVYLTSGKPYAKKEKVKWWTWIFVVLCVLIPIVSLGGAIPCVLGLGGATGCVGIQRNKKIASPIKVILMIGLTILCWILLFLLVGLMTGEL